ncbi:MAG TPA: hypothetical protein RMG48_03210 [Myxococcales bacterium LLY-WYZ-16_1]|nr:hypothetical protein [Myxococcales bacterium LLY-WYZ-16_1]
MERAWPFTFLVSLFLIGTLACGDAPIGLRLVQAPPFIGAGNTGFLLVQVLNEDSAPANDHRVEFFSLDPTAASLRALGDSAPGARRVSRYSGPAELDGIRLSGVADVEVVVSSTGAATMMEILVWVDGAEPDLSDPDAPLPALSVRIERRDDRESG